MLAFFIAGLVLAAFAGLNVLTWRALNAFHPRRRTAILVVTLLGNAFWPGLLLMLAARGSALSRVTRSVLSPPWFSWLIFIILYSAFVALLALLWLPFRKRRKFQEFGSRPSAIFLAILGVATVFGIYDALVPLRVKQVPVQISGLPRELDGYRFALISDLHVGMFSRPSRIRTIVDRASATAPDAILVAGDFIDDDPYFVPKFLAAFENVPPALPVYAVLGNHEIYGAPEKVTSRMRGQSKVRLLVNEGVLLGKGNGTLWLAGISDYAASEKFAPQFRPDVARALRGRPAAALPILLAHQPKGFPDARNAGIPLTLTGHSHGGQFGIRALNWSLAGVFIPYHMGLYREGAHQLFVSTGAGYWVVPFRLGMSPEIAVIELRSAR